MQVHVIASICAMCLVKNRINGCHGVDCTTSLGSDTYLQIYLSFFLSIYLSIYLYLSFYLSIYRSVQRVNLESNLTRQLLCVQAEKHVNQWL